jgi:hypothetical protein
LPCRASTCYRAGRKPFIAAVNLRWLNFQHAQNTVSQISAATRFSSQPLPSFDHLTPVSLLSAFKQLFESLGRLVESLWLLSGILTAIAIFRFRFRKV